MMNTIRRIRPAIAGRKITWADAMWVLSGQAFYHRNYECPICVIAQKEKELRCEP